MAPRRKLKPLCLAQTRTGPCQNYADTCPFMSHRAYKAGAASDTNPPHETIMEMDTSDGDEAEPLHLKQGFAEILDATADHYRLSPWQVCKDYHLVRALHVLGRIIGPNLKVPTIYTKRHAIAGHLLFGGGTALAAAWQVSERYSEDIGLVLVPADGVNTKHIKQSLSDLGLTWAKRLEGIFEESSRSRKHNFFVIRVQDPVLGPVMLDVDITIKNLPQPPNYVQRRKPVSLLGRLADENVSESQPELGRSSRSSLVATMGPGLTAMEKLLAQTDLSQRNDTQGISDRARDIYDLACLAKQAHLFEGHIGRDSPALLALAEEHRQQVDAAKRPADGFTSIASFRPGTSQYEALVAGYETMQESMVWGRRIPLEHAIALAVSLDPGPPSSAAD